MLGLQVAEVAFSALRVRGMVLLAPSVPQVGSSTHFLSLLLAAKIGVVGLQVAEEALSAFKVKGKELSAPSVPQVLSSTHFLSELLATRY